MPEMNRRGFLKALTTAAVGAAVVAHVPVRWMPSGALRDETALAYLRRAYNDWRDATGLDPKVIEIGSDLFDAAQGQMQANMRFCDPTVPVVERSLKFKAATLRERGHGWQVKAIHA